jgi:hypothetical protein
MQKMPPIWPNTIEDPCATHSYTPDLHRITGVTSSQVIIDDPHAPAPDPWGSTYAMNTENWK